MTDYLPCSSPVSVAWDPGEPMMSVSPSLNGKLESQGAQDRKNPLRKPSGRKTSSWLIGQSAFCFVQGLKGLGWAHPGMEFLSFTSRCCHRMPWQMQLGGEGVCLGEMIYVPHNCRLLSVIVGNPTSQELKASSHSVSTVKSQEQWADACTLELNLLSPPGPEMVPSTVGGSFQLNYHNPDTLTTPPQISPQASLV